MVVLRPVPILVLFASMPAAAYDGLEADMAVCTQGNERDAVVAACTRLIDNAAVENAITGMFYGLRAASSVDKAQNYADAKNSLSLADDEAIKNNPAADRSELLRRILMPVVLGLRERRPRVGHCP